ncbi:hypothetical protein HG531_010034 [Fusarium graminearum]|nr:hypothetical protein HG531_010034 [Fusarium graminearum]
MLRVLRLVRFILLVHKLQPLLFKVGDHLIACLNTCLVALCGQVRHGLDWIALQVLNLLLKDLIATLHRRNDEFTILDHRSTQLDILLRGQSGPFDLASHLQVLEEVSLGLTLPVLDKLCDVLEKAMSLDTKLSAVPNCNLVSLLGLVICTSGNLLGG